jgi:hypothetical protein
MWNNYNGIWVGKSSSSWSSYWTPSSAVVEAAAPTDVVMTYAKKVNPTEAIAGNFTISGKTISGASLDGTGLILTLTVTVAFVYGDSITVVANSQNIAVTNNVAAEAELTTYITGLSTPLSAPHKTKLNNFIKSLKAGLSITDLDDAFDCMYILAGETAESSLKNLVKNAHHCTAVNSPTFTALEGFVGGVGKHLNTNYTPSTEGVNYTLNNASMGRYSRTSEGDYYDMGARNSIDSSDCIIIGRFPDNSSHGRINNWAGDGTGSITGLITDAKGMFIVTRNSANINDAFRYLNKTLIQSTNLPSKSLPNRSIWIMNSNEGNDGSPCTNRQFAFAFVGKHITTAMRDVIIDSIEAYMDSNGKGVLA